MQTPDQICAARGGFHRRLRSGTVRACCVLLAALAALLVAGCSKHSGMEAIETDAHGYYCEHCGAKFYTGPNVFMEADCPKCQQYTLVDVVGYLCPADHHLTLSPQVHGHSNAGVCEVCKAPLKNAMVAPREKDLVAWGAAKTAPKPH
jgi:hypothetical protein